MFEIKTDRPDIIQAILKGIAKEYGPIEGTTEEETGVIKAFSSGLPQEKLEALAAKYDERAPKLKRGPKPLFNKTGIKSLKRAIKEGVSYQWLANNYECSTSTIRRYVNA